MDESGGDIPFTLLEDIPLDLPQGSVIEDVSVWITQHAHRWFDSHSQTSNRFEDGLVELIQSSPFQSPVECLAHISASPSKVNVILVVCHRVLDKRGSEVRLLEWLEMHPNDRQEDASRAEGNLSWWNTTGVLRKVQTLDDHI